MNAELQTAPPEAPARSTAPGLEHWREAMAHLRHLDQEVWVGLRTFLPANGFLCLAIVALFGFAAPGARTNWLVLVLAVAGLGLTLIGRYILRRHRVYYLQMLLKKCLLERELGLYDTKLCNSTTDLAFPWRLTPAVVEDLRREPEAWVEKSIRGPGTIARYQFLLYDALLVLYAAALLLSGLALLAR